MKGEKLIMNWDLLDAIVTVAAFLMSAVSLIWQFVSHFADIKLDVVRIYRHVGDLEPQYIFRMHFINNSSTAVIVKNGEERVEVECSKLRLIKIIHRSSTAKGINGEVEVTEKITDRGRLYSHELPFKVEGYGVEGGEFYLLDKDNKLKIDEVSTLTVIVCTNKKNIEFEIPIKDVLMWDDFEVCLE